MVRHVDLRAAAVDALFDVGIIADPADDLEKLVDVVGHPNHGKRGPKTKLVVEPRPDKKRKIKKLRIRFGYKRKSLEVEYNPKIPVLDHPTVRMQVALFRQEIRRGNFVRVDPYSMKVEDILQFLLDQQGARNPARAYQQANHVEQLNECFAGRRLDDLDPATMGQEYWKFRGSRQIKTELKCDDPNARTNTSFRTACIHLDTLKQAIILVCRRGKTVRFEFDMPFGYIEEVEALTWPEFKRLLLACHGLIWDEKGGKDGCGGWKTETYVDANGEVRERYLVAEEPLRRRGAMLARFLLIYAFTGTRYSQILKMRWRPSLTEPYIDFEHREIVRDSRDGRVVTNKRRETSALLGLLFRMLQRWFARDQAAGHDEYVIHKPGSAAPYVDLDYTIAQFAARAGLPHFHAHMAKHTGVTILASKGFTSAEIAGLYSTTAEVIEATYTDLGKYFQHETVAKAETRGFGAFAGFAPTPDLARLAA